MKSARNPETALEITHLKTKSALTNRIIPEISRLLTENILQTLTFSKKVVTSCEVVIRCFAQQIVFLNKQKCCSAYAAYVTIIVQAVEVYYKTQKRKSEFFQWPLGP